MVYKSRRKPMKPSTRIRRTKPTKPRTKPALGKPYVSGKPSRPATKPSRPKTKPALGGPSRPASKPGTRPYGAGRPKVRRTRTRRMR